MTYQVPGGDAFKRIRVNGEIKEVQIKYLVVILIEVRVLFTQNKKSMYVNFSKFAELCRAHIYLQCDIPHNVCTCIVHENVKFLLAVMHKKQVPFETEFQGFMSQVVCDQNEEECMQSDCEKCPMLSEIDISE